MISAVPAAVGWTPFPAGCLISDWLLESVDRELADWPNNPPLVEEVAFKSESSTP